MKTERKRWSRNTEYHLKKDSVNALFTKKNESETENAIPSIF